MSTVRTNLLTRKGYTPYCGDEKCCSESFVARPWPRTSFNGKQFKCKACGWESSFEIEFIEKYKVFQKEPSNVQ